MAAHPHTEQLLRIGDVETRVAMKKTRIYKLISENKFPKQIHLGSRTAMWVSAEIDQWIRELIEASRGSEREQP